MGKMDQVFEAMRSTELSIAVGGGDPAVVGQQNFDCIVENVALAKTDHVLDFGCGIGRTSVVLADYLSEGAIVGNDIIPSAIKFCREQIGARFDAAKFYCTDSVNPLYAHISGGEAERVGEQAWLAEHKHQFDLVVAFSVFTHFDPPMAQKYFALLKEALKPKGLLLSTWFFDRADNWAERRLGTNEDFKDQNNNEPLLCAIFRPAYVQQLALEAGLTLERISFGWWRTGIQSSLRGQHYQDLAIFRA